MFRFAAALISMLAAPALADPQALAFLREARAVSGGDAWNAPAIQLTSEVEADQGSGTAVTVIDLRDGRMRTDVDAGLFEVTMGFDGARGWQRIPFSGTSYREGAEVAPRLVSEAYLRARAYFRPDAGGAAVEALPPETIAGVPATVLRLTPQGGLPLVLAFNSASKEMVRSKIDGGPRPGGFTLISDYKAFGPIRLGTLQLAHRADGTVATTTRIVDVKILPDVAGVDFSKP